MNLDKELNRYFERFEAGHQLARARLLASLSQDRLEPASAGDVVADRSDRRMVRYRRAFRIALAAAAVLLIGMGVMWFDQPADTPISTANVWAAAVDNVSHIRSLHLRAGTGNSTLEMWWRQNGDFRMEISNGVVHTRNENERAYFDAAHKTLTLKNNFQGFGPEMLILGELGQLFTMNRTLSRSLLENSTLVSEEPTVYKGQKAVVRTFQKNDQPNTLHRCIVGLEPPVIYEAATYSAKNPDKPLYRIEILEMDKEYPDYLFTVTPTDDMTVRDMRREGLQK